MCQKDLACAWLGVYVGCPWLLEAKSTPHKAKHFRVECSGWLVETTISKALDHKHKIH